MCYVSVIPEAEKEGFETDCDVSYFYFFIYIKLSNNNYCLYKIYIFTNIKWNKNLILSVKKA